MKFTVAKKLYLGFAFVLILMGGLGWIAIDKMAVINSKTTEIELNWLPSVHYIGEIASLTESVHALEAKHIIATSTPKKSEYEAEINKRLVSLQEIFVEYEKLISVEYERSTFTMFLQSWDDYIAIQEKVLEASRTNNSTRGGALTLQAEQKFEEMQGYLTKLDEINYDGAISASHEADELYANGTRDTITLLIVALIFGIAIAFIISRLISKPVQSMAVLAEQISKGDLTADELRVKNRDEIGDLAKSFNLMASNLRTLIQQVGTTAEQVAASAEELTASAEQTGHATEQVATTMQSVAAGVDKQVHSIEESSQTINEMSAGIQQIASSSQNVLNTAMATSDKAAEGGKVIHTAVEQMNSINTTVLGLGNVVTDLGARSSEIGKIIEVITGIAEQTNLLALNAAIEAARAGEHGKGFAVVADEVRKLAEQSSQSAQQISQLISMIQGETTKAVQSMEVATKEVQEGIGAVNTAGASFEHIQTSVNEVNVQIQEVSSAVQQMAAGTEQMVHSMKLITQIAEGSASGTQEVSAATEEQLASMEEITSSASSLSEIAEELQTLISRFKV
ncbi:methyl-accepting chemotaxis protein [Cytobacillus suaedae]|nr:methyl-accepting chemotaxis protein [Cytobacillus suaedae]